MASTDYTQLSLAEVIREIQQVSADTRTSFGGLTAAQLNWKPAPDAWSVGECLEHLIQSNGLYMEIGERVAAGQYRTPLMGRVPGYAGMCGKWLVKVVSPQNERKYKTMSVFEPARSEVDVDVVDRFSENHNQLIEVIRKTEGSGPEGVIIASPVGPLLVYSLMDAWRVLAGHGRRHLQQAQRVTESEGFPS